MGTILAGLVAGGVLERIIHYAAIAIRVYRKYRAVKGFLSGGERAKLSALEKALKAEPLTAAQKAKLTPEELAVLTDEKALLNSP